MFSTRTLNALKKLAKKVCSTATDADLEKFRTIDEVINYITEKFDGTAAAE